MNVLRRQALPDPPAKQQHFQPSSSQSDVLLVSGDVTSTHIPFPRHYVTPLPGRDFHGYEVPVHHAECASQEPVYTQIQDGEDIYDDTEVLWTTN